MRESFLQFMDNELALGIVLTACGLPASYKTETTEVIGLLCPPHRYDQTGGFKRRRYV